jgi:hypothetical protein
VRHVCLDSEHKGFLIVTVEINNPYLGVALHHRCLQAVHAINDSHSPPLDQNWGHVSRAVQKSLDMINILAASPRRVSGLQIGDRNHNNV